MQTKLIIALSIILSVFTLLIMALVTRFLVQKHSKHGTDKDVFITNGSLESQRQLTNVSSFWKRLFTLKRGKQFVRTAPSIASVLRAGDEGLYPCTLVSDLQHHAGNVTLEPTYEMFTNKTDLRTTARHSVNLDDVAKLHSETRLGTSGIRRAKSMTLKRAASRRTDSSSDNLRRKSTEFSLAEKSLGRSFSTKRPAPMLIPMHHGLRKDPPGGLQHQGPSSESQVIEHINGKAGVRISPRELAALFIISGQGFELANAHPASTDTAFSLALQLQQLEDDETQVSFIKHKPSISQKRALGSGPSPLFAKYISIGALPFSSDLGVVDSILLDGDTFEAIQAGASLSVKPSKTRSIQSQYLRWLPNSHDQQFHILATTAKRLSSSTLTDAIAALPFVGGLVPLASTPLIRTVQFAASGNAPLGRLLQRLEGLVDKTHRFSPHLDIFGPLYHPQNAGLLYREQERLGKLAKTSGVTDTLPDKTARVSRYVTLLERLMALVPNMRPEDVFEAVQEATKNELWRTYKKSVTQHANRASPKTSSNVAPRKQVQFITSGEAESSASGSQRVSTEPAPDLGKQLEQVLKKDLPFSIETVAFVARMVIVAWTLSVCPVAWEEGEAGIRLPRQEDFPERMFLC